MTDAWSATDIVNRRHGRNDGVNLTDLVDGVDASRSEMYQYSPAGRLQHATGAYGDIGYAYDAVGNRIGESLVNSGIGVDTSTSYEVSSNRLVEATRNGSRVRSFTHDAAGNMVTDNRAGTAYNYRYNNRGRLDQLSIGTAVTADYAYDGLERLAIRALQSVTSAATAHYVYGLAGHLIAEATASGVTVREYIWLDDMPLALAANVDTAAPNTWFVHADHLDRAIKMSDVTKNTVWDALYLPFGDVDVILGSAASNLRFPGQYFLLESGLYYNWHRHYDPTLGRYIQPDPLSDVLATQPINGSRFGLVARRAISQASQAELSDLPIGGTIGLNDRGQLGLADGLKTSIYQFAAQLLRDAGNKRLRGAIDLQANATGIALREGLFRPLIRGTIE